MDKEEKEFWAERAKFREQNEEAKAKAGRYQLAEAAQFIADNSTENVDSMMRMLFKEARNGRLTVYEPGTNVPYQFSAIENLDNEVWLEAYWNDLNEWLKINGPRLDCKFPKPDAPAAKVEAVRLPVATQQNNAILNWLKVNQYDPSKLPVPPSGKAGVKKLCRDALCESSKQLFSSESVFNTAWERLRAKGEIKDASDTHP